MSRIRMLVVCVVVVASVGVWAANAGACTDSWKSAVSGSWSTASDWSNGNVPTNNDDVCITVPGTYTVTFAPYASNSGATVHSLTLGGSSGAQTLDISGQASISSNNETQNVTGLTLTIGGTINSSGSLVLDATGGGSPTAGGQRGGDAVLIDSGPLMNAGRIVTQVEDKSWQAFFSGTLTNERSGSITVSSGGLTLPSPSTSGYGAGYAFAVTNDGSLTVGPRGALALDGEIGASGAFTNDGKVSDRGSVTATEEGGPVTWTQSGGSMAGNPVVLQRALLVDSAGPGAFLFDLASGALTGKIPAGQTVTVRGAAYSYQGDNYNGTSLTLNNPQNTAPAVVNDGTLVLDSPGRGGSSGGPASLAGGALDNYGTLVTTVEDPSWANMLKAGLVNEGSGKIDVESGVLAQNAAVASINHGIATIAPGAQWALDEGASFVNERGGTIALEIASRTRAGAFQLTGPCCAGPGKLSAGGTLAPLLEHGYVPAGKTGFELFLLDGGQFSGTFATVGHGFAADYSHEATTPAYAGAIYGASQTSTPVKAKK